MNRCAYCLKNENRLTREHIMPKGILKLLNQENTDHHFFLEKSPSKFLLNEPTVKDVCNDCNNGELSKLDSFALNFLKKYCNVIVEAGNGLTLEYDWDLLARWILKVHYNSARVHNRELKLLAPLRNYILKAQKKPKNIELFGFLIKPKELSEEEKLMMIRSGMDEEPITPDMFRVSVLRFGTRIRGNKAARAIFYKSVCLGFIMLSRKASKREMEQFKSDFLLLRNGPQILNKNAKKIHLKPAVWNQIDAVKDHYNIFEQDYSGLENWLEQNNN